ncbi:hypothetical protein HPB47_013575 [Ixodes persulcatus]|uniref:Uncharacterized protein n=1 Tax=Ixodes persulcatus TaxID=34615 RepID=A0AC60QY52_IXOPE|nr:hypothetical protein HPB47_013575 [Ixodes persulcatus]
MPPPSQAPPKAQSFVFSAPAEVPVDEIIDSLYRLVGEDSLTHLQHFGAMKFLAAVGSTAAADKMVAQGHLLLRSIVVPLEQVGPRIIKVAVFRLPPCVPDDALQAVFSSYGKELAISHLTYKDRPKLFTGTRVLRMEMKTPVPNFVNVGGHRVMCEYRGMKKVCARCGLEGHFGAACRTPLCDRCGVFGHGTDGCNAPCKRRGHNHATTDCTQCRSYSAVIRDEGLSDPRHPTLTAPDPPDSTPGAPPQPAETHPPVGVPPAAPSEASRRDGPDSDADPEAQTGADTASSSTSDPGVRPRTPAESATDNTESMESSPSESDSVSISELDHAAKRGPPSSSDSGPGPIPLTRDFNCVINSFQDVWGRGWGRSTWNAKVIRQFHLVDAWDVKNPNVFGYTWARRGSYSRLDRAYLPANFPFPVTRCEIVPRLARGLSRTTYRAGRSALWRMDVNLLRNPSSVAELRSSIAETLSQQPFDPTQWDGLKAAWQALLASAGRSRRARQTAPLNDLIRRMRIVQRGGTGTLLMQEFLSVLRARYGRVLKPVKRTQTQVSEPAFRYNSRTASAQFLKGRPVSDPEVVLPDGSVSFRQDDIDAAFREYFSRLYASAQSDTPCEFAADVRQFCGDLPGVPTEMSEGLVRPATRQEVVDVLRSMKTGSAPGPDGLPTEFYSKFWDVLAPILNRGGQSRY